MGIPVDMDEIYGKLYNHALTGNADCEASSHTTTYQANL